MNAGENPGPGLSDDQLLRYSRQIMLPSIDLSGQERLLGSRVLVLGLGGLGAPVAMYLAASGIGHLVLVDYDDVELSNLQRQIIHQTDSIGTPKVESAAVRIEKLNPEIRVTLINNKLSPPAASRISTNETLREWARASLIPLVSLGRLLDDADAAKDQ